jgi:23S rRNA (adenine2503-C2)-methyltransferase
MVITNEFYFIIRDWLKADRHLARRLFTGSKFAADGVGMPSVKADRIQIIDLSYAGLKAFVAGLGEPAFRADQLLGWIYRKNATSFAEMTDLSISLRQKLEETAVILTLTLIEERVSHDGLTRKALFRLGDGNTIETAYMAYIANGDELSTTRKRGTVCVSSQVGCAIKCPFCATGQQGFTRNLTPGEIIEQALYYQRTLAAAGAKIDNKTRRPVNNVVFMGMGEPLANYDNVVAAVGMLNFPRGMGLSTRQITLSTSGLAREIRRLADDAVHVELAVSLHAATDDLRNSLVPVNRAVPLAELMIACRYFIMKTGRRPTFEWALFRGVNDSPAQLEALVKLIAGNKTSSKDFLPAGEKQVKAFKEALESRGVFATIRGARGQDIEAGCGQLRSRYLTVVKPDAIGQNKPVQ